MTWEQELESAPGTIPADDLDVIQFCKEQLAFVPEERQAEVLRSESSRVILNCSRQWGKSTIAAAKAIHRGYAKPGCLVVVASPTERQSAEFVRKASELLSRMGERVRGDGDNKVSLMLPSGSRIVGLPGKEGNVRGFSAVSLLLIDEAARVPDSLYRALRPMLAVGGGDLWLMSTPMGKRGFFYEAWTHGGSHWTRFESPVLDCPRISQEFLEEERREQGDLWFRQEYLCEFVDNGTQLFGRDLVEAALEDMDSRRVRGSVFIGVDLGKMQDFTAIAVVERDEQALAWMPTVYRDLRVRQLERLPLGTPYTLVVERIREICDEYAGVARCHLVVDATGVGAPVVDMLRTARLRCGMTAVSITGGDRAGGRGESRSVPKRDLLSGVQVALEKGELRIGRKLKEAGSLVKELIHMRGDGGQSEHDDLVMAVALACWKARVAEVGPQGGRLPGM